MASTARAEALEVLRTMPRHLETALRGTPRALLLWPPAPGRWCIAEVLAHCEEIERAVYLPAYAQAAAGEPVEVPSYDTDARVLARGAPSESAPEILRSWKRARRDGLARLESLPEAAWATCINSAGRPLALEEFVTRHAAHDCTHGRQIDGIVERHALLGRLHATPGELAALLDLAPAASEEVRPALQRLVDAERRFLLAYVRILEQERPPLGWLGGAPEPPARPAAALATLRRDFEKLRGATHALLYASGPRAWQRRGIDPRLGERTLAELVARQLDHDAESLAALRDILTWAPAPSPPR